MNNPNPRDEVELLPLLHAAVSQLGRRPDRAEGYIRQVIEMLRARATPPTPVAKCVTGADDASSHDIETCTRWHHGTYYPQRNCSCAAKHYYCDEGTDEDPTPVHRCETVPPTPVEDEKYWIAELDRRIDAPGSDDLMSEVHSVIRDILTRLSQQTPHRCPNCWERN